MKKICYFILILLFVSVGCTNKNDVTENYVRVIPSKLFEGDAKKLEPHLGMITGCVKIKYQGDKESIGLKYEIWENGKIKESLDGMSKPIDENVFDGEISISLKDIIDIDLEKSDFMIMRIFISDDNGYGGSTRYIKRFENDCSYGPVEIDGEIKVSDGDEIAVWGVTAYKDSYSSGGTSIEEQVKAADWGLVLKIYFK